MNKERYYELIKETVPPVNKKKNGLMAFIMGGFLSLVAEVVNIILENNTDLISENRTIIIILGFIFLGSLLTGFGIFDNLAQIFGAGLFIPITGFANAVCSEALEYKSEGPIYGIGANMFKLAGSVITYGVITSIILTLIYAIFL